MTVASSTAILVVVQVSHADLTTYRTSGPSANATRGQASKIVANTFFPNCQTPNKANR